MRTARDAQVKGGLAVAEVLQTVSTSLWKCRRQVRSAGEFLEDVTDRPSFELTSVCLTNIVFLDYKIHPRLYTLVKYYS